ncbi:MAG: transposase [Acidimicrobiales bacterium]
MGWSTQTVDQSTRLTLIGSLSNRPVRSRWWIPCGRPLETGRLLPTRRRGRHPALTPLAKTVSWWEIEILDYRATRISSGPTEAQNRIAKKLRRIEHGMRNFENYRLRLLLRPGAAWNTLSTDQIKGRYPRLIA